MRVSREEFLSLAERAFDEIPAFFREKLVNVELSVVDRPGRESGRDRGSRTLLGLYVGPPREELERSAGEPPLPARILLYQRNIEDACRKRSELEREIRLTLRHEIAHHFGFSDGELQEFWPEGC